MIILEQTCSMIFGSWTFNKEEVRINYLDGKRQVELNDYSFSGIWDIMVRLKRKLGWDLLYKIQNSDCDSDLEQTTKRPRADWSNQRALSSLIGF